MKTTSRIKNEQVNPYTTVLLPSYTLEHNGFNELTCNSFDKLEQTIRHIETLDNLDCKLIFKMVKMIAMFAKKCGAIGVEMYPIITRLKRTHLMLRFSFTTEDEMKLFKSENV